MPLYEYRCSSCGHQQEFLQKWSDAPLTTCTSCGKETFSKMLTAAGFQLKGSGWYATDFKNSGKPKSTGGAKKPEGSDSGKTDAKSEGASDAKSESKGDAKSDGNTKEAGPSRGQGASPACQ
ncbi:MAG: FmdB family zinc ribbon protein [Bacillota bacterium]